MAAAEDLDEDDAAAEALGVADAVLAELGNARHHLLDAEESVTAWLLGSGGLADAMDGERKLAQALDRRRRRARALLRDQIEEEKRERVRRRLADGK